MSFAIDPRLVNVYETCITENGNALLNKSVLKVMDMDKIG